MKTPFLETNRLILRPLKLEDAQRVYESWTSDDEVSKFVRWSTHENVEVTKQWMSAEEKDIESDFNYTWGIALKSDEKLIGAGSLIMNEEKGCFELGYNLMKTQWGKGYATEFSKKALEFAKNTLNQEKIYCCHAEENTASMRVIQKLGFEYMGDATYKKFDGTPFKSREYCKNL